MTVGYLRLERNSSCHSLFTEAQSLYFLLKVRRARVIKTNFENNEKKNKTTFIFLFRAPRSPNKTTSFYRLFLSLHLFFYFYKIQFVKYYKNKKATCKDSQGRLIGVATVTQERFSFKD